ncbi:hypothetical protein GCM10010213_22000 [Microbacterium maritypicum]|uniref:Uncharacterized protein n=1 Tax=Microbacterium maritypicum TaxID=33918 RepID=A0A4Y4B717_MICMQ|nr:hypothetical protein MLI01_23310 [Microbacterium liquefaciens]GGV59431.1 hypothetical protein GCM10010213_22000 [Microbacterium liquefaciens]
MRSRGDQPTRRGESEPRGPTGDECTLSTDLHLMFSFERRRATCIDGTQYQPTWFLVSPRPGELHRERAYDTAWIDGMIPLIVVGQDGRMSIPSTSVDVPVRVRELARGAALTPVWLNGIGGG